MASPLSRSPLLPLGLSVALFGTVSAWFGPDASWDLRNYHLYDGYAALTGRLWRDIAPAQLQTFYHPGLDTCLFVLRRALNAHPVLLDFLLGIPHGIAVWLVYLLALTCLPATPFPRLAALVVTVFGATGAAALPTLGTASSEMIPGSLVLAALLLLLRGAGGLGPGLLVGGAIGLKLTFAPYAVGLAAGLVATRRRSLLSFAPGVALALAAIAGPWWWTLWRHTGNPLFPYFNDVFRSPLIPSLPFTDATFLPKDWVHALLFPLLWAYQANNASAEFFLRDPRLAIALACCAFLIAQRIGNWFRKRAPAPDGLALLLVFWVVTFGAWEARFSILRYTAVLELLSGIPVALAAITLLSRRLALPAIAAGTAAVWAFTIYPNWGRATPSALAADVRFPPLPPDSLVLLLDGAPMAYVAAFAPPDLRFAGVNSNLLRPGQGGGLEQAIFKTLEAHQGPLWGLDSPEDRPGEAARALSFYGLERAGPCVRVRSNLDHDAIRACPLRRLMPLREREAPVSQARPGPD